MKKRLVPTVLILVAMVAAPLLAAGHAFAFSRNNLIDDGIFDNTRSMAASQINDFLNNFPNSCISQNHGFSAPLPIGYSPSSGFQYGPYKSAGEVISAAANAYGINPQVLLTTLQKEQTLVSGGAGCSILRYVGATGYGCPDGGTTYSYSGLNLYAINGNVVSSVSGTCVNTSAKAGFSQQVIRAAWLLKFGEQRSEGNINWAVINGGWDNSDDPQSCYSGPVTQGYRQVCPSGSTTYYDGYTTIDGTAVHMDNGATAALYWYTPHFSGNQNFDSIFSGWFGTLYTSTSVSNIAWNFETVDGSATGLSKTYGDFGLYSNTLTAGSTLHVFYYDASNGFLKHASWDSTNGWLFETVDGGGGANGQIAANVGGYPKSILYNGVVYVAYYDFTNHTIRLSHKVGSTWIAQTLDGDGAPGHYGAVTGQDISMATYGSSLQIFYSDVTNGNLRHAWTDGVGAPFKFENLDGDYGSIAHWDGFVGQGINAQLYNPDNLQLFYLDSSRGNLRHAWTDARGWHFENLDGDPGSISHYDGSVGAFPNFTKFQGIMQLYYYDMARHVLRHGWNDRSGWHFENLDGDIGSISHYTGDVGMRPIVLPLNDSSLNIFYYDATKMSLRQAYADATGWHFASVDGTPDAVSGSSHALNAYPSGSTFGSSGQLFYYDLNTHSLKHAWGNLRF